MIDLASVLNFRDIGGHATADGRRVREGVVFRSGHLAGLVPRDRETLERIGVRQVIDFRTSSDVGADGGSPLPRGARRVHLPMGDPAKAPTDLRALLLGGEREALQRHLGDGQGATMMQAAAEALVVEQCPQYGGMLEAIAAPDGVPAIIHCSAGKDRTGWGASLLLLVAGVPDDAIVAHYAESDSHRASETERVLAALPDGVDPDWLRPFFECRPEYARTSLATLRARWSDVDAYVTEGLGVAAETLGSVRARLVE